MDRSEKHRILVVEPDPSIRALVVALLNREGYTTDAVENADAALQARRRLAHAAVVVEPRMPGGAMLLAALRADAQLNANVIVITTPDWREPMYASDDVRGVLRKPFHLEELCALVAGCLQDGSRPQARQPDRSSTLESSR